MAQIIRIFYRYINIHKFLESNAHFPSCPFLLKDGGSWDPIIHDANDLAFLE